jgi:integrase
MKKKERTYRFTSPMGIDISIKDRGVRGWFHSHKPPFGHRLRHLITKGSREQAVKLAIDEIEKLYRIHEQGGTPTILRVAAEMIAAKEREGRAHDYRRKIDEHLRGYILPALGMDTPIGAVDAKQLLAFKKSLGASDLNPQTCNRVLTSLRQIFKFAEDPSGYLVAPALPRNFNTPPWEQQEKWNLLVPERIAELLAIAPDEVRPLLGYIANTGLRIGSALETEVAWIDFPRRMVRYPASAMKGRHPHVVELNGAAEGFLREALSSFPDKPFPYSYWFVLKRWVLLREEFRMPKLRIHDLRHSFISNQLAAGTPIHVVRDMAAHRNLVITARYAHGTDEARRAASDRVQIVVGNRPAASADLAAVAPTVAPDARERSRRKRKSPLNQEAYRVPKGGIEPPTRGFSIPCSTN